MHAFKLHLILLLVTAQLTSCASEEVVNTNKSFFCESDTVLRQQMLTLVNSARSNGQVCNGQFFAATRAVTWNNLLTQAAKSHSDEMATNNFFDHVGLDGLEVGGRIQAKGYPFISAAENISAGRQNSIEAVNSWLNSTTGHCESLMNPNFREMGVACSRNLNSEFVTYYTQVFGLR